MTIDSWREGRDDEGWREISATFSAKFKRPLDDRGPKRVQPVPRLAGDIEALQELTKYERPPRRRVRPVRSAVALYGFGDTSGAGFGISIWDPNSGTEADYGTWNEVVSDKPSNFRELKNLVMKIKSMILEGRLHEGAELYLFTDNFTAESVFSKGDARSRDLFDLVLELHQLELSHSLFVHVIWVSGKRMIYQGTDGLSRGDLLSGVMLGQHMLEFVPLNKSAMERHCYGVRLLLDRTVGPDVEVTFLEPADWYTLPFDSDGVFIWIPPPALADVAVKLMSKAQHVRPWNTHIFIVPNLMTSRWRKQLTKASDFLVTVPFEDNIWPELGESGQFERLTLAFAFPLLNSEPWRVKRTKFRTTLAASLRSMRSPSFAHVGDRVRNLWIQARTLEPMPSGMSRSLLRSSAGIGVSSDVSTKE